MTEEQLKQKRNSLIDAVIDHTTKRIGDLDSSHLLKDMQIFFIINLPETEEELAVYGEEELENLLTYYREVLVSLECDIEHVKNPEWQALKAHMKRQPKSTTTEAFSHRLFTSQNLEERFHNILMLVECILCIPVSSAICERGFSAMTRIKSDWRACLG